METNTPAMDNADSNKLVSTLTKIVSILLVVALILAVVFYNKSKNTPASQNTADQKKVTELVDKVNKIIDLPQGEAPSVATISDLAPLAGNPFFANANIGDEVLLYPSARKVYLYNPVYFEFVYNGGPGYCSIRLWHFGQLSALELY